ncbi:MAG: hypoxanthine phosphoribosyltransferase [Eubacteriales bacterium]
MDVSGYEKVVFSEEVLKERVKSIGEQINRDYAGKDLIMVSVLKGTLYFFADLTRFIDIPIQLDFMAIGVYPNSTNDTGVVRITKDLDADISGKDVLIIEDIIRTGLTTGYLVQNLEARTPASVKVCTLLVNPKQQLIKVPIEYYGFEISDEWLVGYGMDVHEKWRNLPYIAEAGGKE